MTPTITKNAAYVATGLSLLATSFKEKPRFAAIATAILTEAQAVENAAFDVLLLRALDNPLTFGAQLDMIGRLVNQNREGMADVMYIPFLKARIKANKSNGTVETLIAILLLLIGQSTPLRVREAFPKAIEFEADAVSVNAWILFNEFLRVAKAAGTSIRFIFSKSIASLTLKMNSARGSTFTTISTQRVGSFYTVGIGGGVLAGVFG